MKLFQKKWKDFLSKPVHFVLRRTKYIALHSHAKRQQHQLVAKIDDRNTLAENIKKGMTAHFGIRSALESEGEVTPWIQK